MSSELAFFRLATNRQGTLVGFNFCQDKRHFWRALFCFLANSEHITCFAPSCTAEHLCQLCGTSSRNLLKDTQLSKKKENRKRPKSSRTRAHNLLITRHALNRCATTITPGLIQSCQIKMPCSAMASNHTYRQRACRWLALPCHSQWYNN